MRVSISRSLLDRIRQDCARQAPREACGLLLGEGERITDALPAANVAADARTGFEIDPAVLLAAHRQARGGGPAVVGCYHSHPTGDPRPSPTDAALSAPDGTLWLILAGQRHALWRAVPDGSVHGRFDYAALRIEADAACQPPPLAAQGPVSPARPDPLPEPVRLSIDPIEFASLLCSRLCHDLLSPVGAINNGLELLADEHDPEMRARCVELLNESARASANKLKFFRLAFGAAGGFGETVDPREAKAAIEGLFGGGDRIQIGWMVEEAPLSKSALKVLLNLSLIGGDALLRGGTLEIGAERNGGFLEIVVRASGTRLVLDEELRAALLGAGGEAPITPRAAAAYLVHALARAGGGEVMVSGPDAGVLVLGATVGQGSTAS